MAKVTRSLPSWANGSPVTNESGATAVEYGVMLALIVAIIAGVVTLLGLDVRDAFCSVLQAFSHTC